MLSRKQFLRASTRLCVSFFQLNLSTFSKKTIIYNCNFLNSSYPNKCIKTPALSLGISTAILGTNNVSLRKELDDIKETTSEPAETTTETVETTTKPENMEKYRLPSSIIPTHYDLTLKPDLSTGLFDGEVIVKVNLKQKSEEILLHSNGLDIKKVQVGGKDEEYKIDRDYELLVIKSGESGFEGDVEVAIIYSGSLKNRIVGFYQSHYVNEQNKQVSIATSKFEPTYARQAFPCFDEPNMKAKFKIHLLKPKNDDYEALSNMPVEGQTEVENGVMVHFKESVPMSTYLACFIVSDFKANDAVIESPSFPKVPLKVFATPAQLSKTKYALDTGKKVMEYYLDYFKIAYPLPKLDMAAIPDFVSGAMEHWGLVTYRETALLYDENTSSDVNQQRVATVVAHELAHSWFGNLVTMDWWNDLWLNEGFASYIQYKGTNAAEPDWQMMSQFLMEHMHPVLILDATLASHPIVQTVTTPNQITEIFDTISYNKGASILRMLENAITPEKFQEGVTKYLNKFQFSNAVTKDFLDALSSLAKTDIDIIDFVNTWIVQMGYPIVTVKKVEGGYKLTQERFLTNPDHEGKTIIPSSYNYKWTIPVTYITSDNPTPTLVWFKHNQTEVIIPNQSNWIKLNVEQVGYYRANYDTDNWKALTDNFVNFDTTNQAHLLEEVFRIAESGLVSYDVAFDLTKKLENIKEYIPWDVAYTVFRELIRYVKSSSVLKEYEEYVVKLLTPYYTDLGWDNRTGDTHLDRLARLRIINLACSLGQKDCLQKAGELFKKWCADENTVIHPNLREAVYKYGIKSTGAEEWQITWERFNKEIDAAEKLKLLQGLTMSNDASTLSRLIDLAKDETYIRGQDYFTLLQYISANPIGSSLVWDYVREHWLDLVDRFGLNERYLGKMIPQITRGFTTQTKKEEMLAFFKKYPEAGAGEASRKQALETVTNNINWLSKNKATVEAWFTPKP